MRFAAASVFLAPLAVGGPAAGDSAAGRLASGTASSGERMRRSARRVLGAALGIAVAAAASAALAKGPFGVTTPEGGGSGFGGPLGPFFVWIALYQAQFYKALTDALATLKENPWGVWLLLALSFAYGVFHAVGPGHGKAVITSYLVSSGETVRHGVLLSFAAAMVQAAVAIILVVGGAILLRFTAMQITDATDWLEAGSYAAIAVIGVPWTTRPLPG
jgi:nickel/cobalt exporter